MTIFIDEKMVRGQSLDNVGLNVDEKKETERNN